MARLGALTLLGPARSGRAGAMENRGSSATVLRCPVEGGMASRSSHLAE
jgi:hypothetical protein